LSRKDRPVKEFIPTWWDLSGVQFVKHKRGTHINLSRMDEKKKQAVWARIKKEHPALAALLRSDEFKRLVHDFDGEVLIGE